MSKNIYTHEQIQILQSNQYVKSCTEKCITFTDDCKIRALKLDNEHWYYKDIFRYFWFPEFFIDSEAPLRTIKNWRHALKTKWLVNMVDQKRGRKKKIDTSKFTKDEYIQYLEARAEYLEELHRRTAWRYP